MPTLDGKTLHWVQINYGFRPDGRDPSNGQPVTGDIWEELNSNGAAVRFHGHYTFADGTFYQEILQTAGKMTVILGRPNPVNSPAGCALRGQSAPQAVPTAPPFIDVAALSKAGFQPDGGLTKQLPVTVGFPGVQPLIVFGPATTGKGWLSTASVGNGLSKDTRYEVGPNGRVLLSQARVTGANGILVAESWTSYGSLEAYAPFSIPASVFVESQQALGACHA